MARNRKSSPSDVRRKANRAIKQAADLASQINNRENEQRKALNNREVNRVVALESEICELRGHLNETKRRLISMGLLKERIAQSYRPDLAQEMVTDSNGVSLRSGPKHVVPPEATRLSSASKRGWVDTRGQGIR